MCGRFSQTQPLAEVVKRFSAKQPSFNAKPSYNVCPGTQRPVIAASGFKLLKWGFLPGWVSSAPAPSPQPALLPDLPPPEAAPQPREGLINARAEGIASRPAFRAAFYGRRCLVPADGFYEWQQSAGVRTPYRFELRDRALFAMAGVYEEQNGTFAVITCAASALVRPVHHRMPVILERRHEALWLDPKMRDSETLLPLLRAYDSALMHGYKVSDLVNDPANDSPGCLAPRPE